MHAIYNFVSGPLAWVAFILFFGGILYQLIKKRFLLDAQLGSDDADGFDAASRKFKGRPHRLSAPQT